MDASRKRAREGSSSEEDRLSALPDALIHAIMSFLKAHQVVQTSVLAKRWRHLWRSVPSLDIDLPEFNSKINDRAGIGRSYEKFVDFADYLLFHRHQDGSPLDTLRLHVSAGHMARDMDAGRWVRRGLKCSPRMLHVYHSSYHEAQIPLDLGSGPCSSCRLTKLHLVGLSLNCSFAEQIRSVCVVLVELEIKKCEINFQKIASSSLKNLIIDGEHVYYGGHDDHNLLIITAPCLASLHLNLEACYGFLVVSVNETSSLVKASICIWNSDPHDVVYDNQCKLLNSLFNVTSLELVGFCIMAMPDEEPFQFSAFKNLTTLLLDKCNLGDKFQLLQLFLQNSPNLETLTVDCCQLSQGSKRGKGKAMWKKIMSQYQDILDFKCLKLKYTEIIYKRGDIIFPLVNTLLDFSDRLPKNIITLKKV